MSHTDTELREQRGTYIGYTRVSTVSQTLDQQNEALTAANVGADATAAHRKLPGPPFLANSRFPNGKTCATATSNVDLACGLLTAGPVVTLARGAFVLSRG